MPPRGVLFDEAVSPLENCVAFKEIVIEKTLGFSVAYLCPAENTQHRYSSSHRKHGLADLMQMFD